jgi:hypothetical protein
LGACGVRGRGCGFGAVVGGETRRSWEVFWSVTVVVAGSGGKGLTECAGEGCESEAAGGHCLSGAEERERHTCLRFRLFDEDV